MNLEYLVCRLFFILLWLSAGLALLGMNED
ncbi:hypothetical protein ES703_120605 [subsurface metagenome]